MKLRFTIRATQNIAEIADYISARNPKAAEAVRATIYDGLRTPAPVPKCRSPAGD